MIAKNISISKPINGNTKNKYSTSSVKVFIFLLKTKMLETNNMAATIKLITHCHQLNYLIRL
jgi:hypothetical protein